MNILKALTLCSLVLILTHCKKDEDQATPSGDGCFNRGIIEDFFITSINDLVINPLVGEASIDCRPLIRDGSPCRIDIGGSSDGLRSQRCKFIYVFVKSTISDGWFRQEITTSLRNGGDWSTNIQIGDTVQHLPFGLTFEVVAIVTGFDLSGDPNPIGNLEIDLPIDHKKTNFVRIFVAP